MFDFLNGRLQMAGCILLLFGLEKDSGCTDEFIQAGFVSFVQPGGHAPGSLVGHGVHVRLGFLGLAQDCVLGANGLSQWVGGIEGRRPVKGQRTLKQQHQRNPQRDKTYRYVTFHQIEFFEILDFGHERPHWHGILWRSKRVA